VEGGLHQEDIGRSDVVNEIGVKGDFFVRHGRRVTRERTSAGLVPLQPPYIERSDWTNKHGSTERTGREL
jgi:hypothetical protein